MFVWLSRGRGKKTLKTAHYCKECTEEAGVGRVFMGKKVRQHDPNVKNHATCNQIRHAL